MNVSLKALPDKGKYVKDTIENLGGTYEFEDGVHKGWWDAYGDKANLYVAYGRFTATIGILTTPVDLQLGLF